MKRRLDYVTNSSSSSFILARKDKLTDEQKEKIVEYVENNLLGRIIASTKEELIEYIRETEHESAVDDDGNINDYYVYDSNKYKKAFEAIEQGMVIYGGWVSFEEGGSVADIYTDIWSILEDNTNFKGIDTDLDY